MRYSQFFLPTLKEIPAEAELVSHKLMLRAGLIRKLAAGLYTFMPIGLKVLQNIKHIVRREMNRSAALEVLMPMVQPGELWQESGRWEKYGSELLRFKDRHQRDFCLGPTHEEVITDLIRKEVRSYRDLPINLYQIQTKFRDEIRPRFGVMRSREFVMKDSYSFHADIESLDATYREMYDCYCRIFEACGFDFRAVEADTGSIGGDASHEFMVLAESGEDSIAICKSCRFAANLELAPVKAEEFNGIKNFKPLEKVHTPQKGTIEEVTGFLGKSSDLSVKTLVYLINDKIVMILLRGDHQLNEIKLMRYLGVDEVSMCDSDLIETRLNAPVGFLGPMNIPKDITIIADNSLKNLENFITGANEVDYHFINANWERDIPVPVFADIRNITVNDKCPKCGGDIDIRKGIEVGHIFKLGTKYSSSLGAVYLDKDGKTQPIIMGCYGIGVSRIIAACIEQNHDENGIIFPKSIAPFKIIITPVDMRNQDVLNYADDLYRGISELGIEVLLDDRDERAGVKFKDSELLGIPVRITIGKLFKEKNEVEIFLRKGKTTENSHSSLVLEKLKEIF